ncbi:hypothetical protein BASA83_003731, partial [Batrachochytrium salamandrivorans]
QTHWRIRQNYRHRRPDQTRPTAPPPPLSRQILAVNVANISNKRPAIRHIVRNTRLWAISETCITSSKFRFTVLDSMSSSIQPRDLDRRGIALGIPSCFGGHEHGSAVGTMILAKVPNFTPECLWIVGSVYVGHSGATTNYSRREAFASIRQALDRVVPFDNNHPVLILETGTPTRSAFSALSTRGVMTDSSGRPLCHSHIHPSKGSRTTPCSSCSNNIPPHHCLEATDQIATSNYWDVLADGATDDTDTDTDIHQLTCQFLESANAVADNLSLRLSPPGHSIQSPAPIWHNPNVPYWQATLHGKHSLPLQLIPILTQSSGNTLRDEWSRLKAAATQLERVDGRKQWVKHA